MSFGNLKVGTRLGVGFGAVLAIGTIVGLLSWWRMSQLDDIAMQATGADWEKARLTMEMEIRTRDNAAKAARVLLAGDDTALIDQLKEEMAGNTRANGEALARLQELVNDPEARALMDEAAAARDAYTASRARVNELAGDPGTREEAARLFRTETMSLLEDYVAPFRKLTELQRERFAETAARTDATYDVARNTLFGSGLVTFILCAALAMMITRSIVRPLRHAVDIADAVKAGRLDNVIDTSGQDETGQLLASLDAMQGALRARDEKDADYRGQIAAIHRAQAVVEFDMQGHVLDVNENFARTLGYTRDEVIGKHHSLFVEPALAASPEYRGFWARLNRGEHDIGNYKRIARGGREVWLQASYNPIPDASGKPFKVVKYASDVTAQMVRNADNEGQLAAISRAQAVIEFDMDGTVRGANDNFVRLLGYGAGEIAGRHHRLFVDPAEAESAEYGAFWDKLNRGEYAMGQFRRLAKGGREVWIQASYNPIPDANGKPFKVVKYATDVTAAVQAQQALQVAVSQTQDVVRHAADGDLTRRIPLEGKTGELEAACRAVNALLDSTMDLVKRVKMAAGEVQLGAEEISRGNTNLSQRTEEQASSLEETASSMEEMTSTVKQTADNAGQANQLALAARQQAEKGGAVVSAAVTAMNGINEASRKIADIIGVIDEIAFQTNLLALNAAVEAARAGEQGRGFAVVATEVRSLAGRSATAAKEIKALIQDSVGRVDEGSRLVDESGRTLDEIVSAVKKVTDIVAEIAAASREQSSGIEQVNRAVMSMDEATQQNAALVEEAAAASQAIVEQTQSLTRLVARYDVGLAAAPVARLRTEKMDAPDRRAAQRTRTPVVRSARDVYEAPARKVEGADWSEF